MRGNPRDLAKAVAPGVLASFAMVQWARIQKTPLFEPCDPKSEFLVKFVAAEQGKHARGCSGAGVWFFNADNLNVRRIHCKGQPPTICQFLADLPLHPQAELDKARAECARGRAKRAAVGAVLRQSEVRVVKRVEELRAELHLPAFPKGEVLQDGNIYVNEMWSGQGVSADVAHASRSRGGKDAGTEGVVRVGHVCRHGRAGYQVHAVRELVEPAKVPIRGGAHGEGKPAPVNRSSADRPASYRLSRNPVRVSEQRAMCAERELIYRRETYGVVQMVCQPALIHLAVPRIGIGASLAVGG